MEILGCGSARNSWRGTSEAKSGSCEVSLLRLIARLDIKNNTVVKGIQFEGLRVVGDPCAMAKRYAESGADEIFYNDVVATLYGRSAITNILDRTTRDVFIPITVGGGVKSRADVQRLLDSGADKVAINTAAIRNPSLIQELSDYYGSQAIVVSVEAKKRPGAISWEALTDSGREKSEKEAIGWIKEAVELGAGEIFLTSVDQDGTLKGPDTALLEALGWIQVPLVYCGGVGTVEHARRALNAGADAIAMGAALHYNKTNFTEMRAGLTNDERRRKRVLG